MAMHDFLAGLASETMASAIAGAAGGAVRWIKFKEDWRTGVGSLFVGALLSIYASPAIEPLLERVIIDPSKRTGFAGFAIGVGGILIVGFAIDFVKARKEQLIGKKEDAE